MVRISLEIARESEQSFPLLTVTNMTREVGSCF
jgi:hypothetical protein